MSSSISIGHHLHFTLFPASLLILPCLASHPFLPHFSFLPASTFPFICPGFCLPLPHFAFPPLVDLSPLKPSTLLSLTTISMDPSVVSFTDEGQICHYCKKRPGEVTPGPWKPVRSSTTHLVESICAGCAAYYSKKSACEYYFHPVISIQFLPF